MEGSILNGTRDNLERRVAIIMAIYYNDSLHFIQQAISSILSQTYSYFELFIQLDGPIKKDVESFLNTINDERVHVYSRNENFGLAHSLNDLLKIILKKEYNLIARMDADDICFSNRLEKQLEYLRNHPDVECLGTWAIEINSSGKEYFRKKMPETHEECLNMFRKRDCMIHPTVLFRRSFFDKAGLYPTDTYFGEDTLMWAKGFASGCRFANVPEYLYYFRLDDNFFERRRGWKHAKSIFSLRRRVNRMLGFGFRENLYALAYSIAKLMPTQILNFIYKTAR